MSEPMDALAKWDNPARHQFGALVTAAEKIRAAIAEHAACDEWLARTRDDPNISVKEGNVWNQRDFDASAALGAAEEELVTALNALTLEEPQQPGGEMSPDLKAIRKQSQRLRYPTGYTGLPTYQFDAWLDYTEALIAALREIRDSFVLVEEARMPDFSGSLGMYNRRVERFTKAMSAIGALLPPAQPKGDER